MSSRTLGAPRRPRAVRPFVIGVIASLAILTLCGPAFAQATPSNFATLSSRGELESGDKLIVTVMLRRGSSYRPLAGEFVEFAPAMMIVKVGDDDFDPASTDLVVRTVEAGAASPFSDPDHVLIEIPETRTARIARTDGVANGIAIGAMAGILPAVGGIAYCARDAGDCEDNYGKIAGLAAVGAGVGALVGGGIDSARKMEGDVLFEALAPRPELQVSIAPIASRTEKGMRFVIRW